MGSASTVRIVAVGRGARRAQALRLAGGGRGAPGRPSALLGGLRAAGLHAAARPAARRVEHAHGPADPRPVRLHAIAPLYDYVNV